MARSSDQTRPGSPKILYGLADWPPVPQLLLLSVQYAVLAATYLVIVTVVLRSAKLPEADVVGLMCVACVALGVGALIQALPRGPVGAGFLAPVVYSSTYLAPSVLAAKLGGMPLVFSMTIVGGLTEVLLAFMLVRLRLVITPVVTGLTVFIVGLQVGIVGIAQVLDIRHEHQSFFQLHLIVTTVSLATIVGLTVWGRGPLRLICSLAGLIVGVTAATAVGVISQNDFAIVTRVPWVAIPQFTLPSFDFDIRVFPAFIAAGVAATVRVIGNLTAAQRLNDPDWERPDMASLRKGTIGEGVANIVGGAIGAQGMTVSSSLVALSGTTGVTSRAVAYVTAAILVVIGFIPKVAVFFLLVPQEVTGALLVYTSCSLISGGMRIMLSRTEGSRTSFIIGIPTLLALTQNVHAHYFKDLPAIVQSIISNPLTVGLLSGVGLVLLFRIGTRQRAGMTWLPGEDAADRVSSFLRTTATSWAIPTKTIDESDGEVRAVVERLDASGRLGLGGELRLSTDGLDFRVDVIGAVAPLAGEAPTTTLLPFRPVRNEESAGMGGLTTFLDSLAAERKRIVQRNGRTTVALRYGI